MCLNSDGLFFFFLSWWAHLPGKLVLLSCSKGWKGVVHASQLRLLRGLCKGGEGSEKLHSTFTTCVYIDLQLSFRNRFLPRCLLLLYRRKISRIPGLVACTIASCNLSNWNCLNDIFNIATGNCCQPKRWDVLNIFKLESCLFKKNCLFFQHKQMK
jgi:hypothetical protein